MSRLITAVLLSALAIMASGRSLEIHVSPRGYHDGDGSADKPYTTLKAALDHVRALRTSVMEEQPEIHIILADGTYRIDSPVVIDNSVSSPSMPPLTIEAAQGAKPVICGSTTSRNWFVPDSIDNLPAIAQGKVWQSTLPTDVKFRQMWINDRKLRRASTFDDDSTEMIIKADKSDRTITVPRLEVTMTDSPYLEFTVIQDWAMNMMRVKGISTSIGESTLTFMEPEAEIEFKRPWPILRASSESKTNHRFILSNSLSLLNRPQEWYADFTDRKLFYMPQTDEKPENTVAEIPVLETLLQIAGNDTCRAGNIEIKGISFKYTTFLRPNDYGHVTLQAGQYLIDAYSKATATADNVAWVGRPTSAVSISNASNVSFERCDFAHLGSTAIDFVEGVTNGLVAGCTFHDIGGNAVSGGFFGNESFEVHQAYNPVNINEICDVLEISDCHFTDIANEDWGCVAIGIGFASRVNIHHNKIVNTPYSAISLGWGWVNEKSIMHDNHIDYNHIDGFALQMRDAGAIYTLSAQPQSTITGNRIEGQGQPKHNPIMWESMKHAQFEIYTDEGSNHFTIKDNILELGAISRNKNGSNMIWENNHP